MFTPDQIQTIRQKLADGVIPEKIADDFGIALNTLRYRLGKSGYDIKSKNTRELVKVTPVEELGTAK